MMFYSFIGFLFYLLILGSCSQNDGDCRTLNFKTRVEGNSLFGHVVRSYLINSQDDCELKCYIEDKCMSINFGAGDNGAYLCELSDSDHDLHPEDLKKRDGFIYIPTENACISNPCSVNGRYQTGFTDKGYHCVCSAGFTGEDCSIDMQVPAQPGISCRDILQSGRSVGDGAYLIDPEGDGNPLKVYCDMTTDGGGWLLVANIVINGSSPSSDWSPDQDYTGIRSYLTNRMGISKIALKELKAHLSFTQLRFYCRKQKGRTFHVVTAPNHTGEAVVQYFSALSTGRPDACGSFVRMADDNSRLASSCHRWSVNGKWGSSDNNGKYQMYRYAAFIPQKYNWHINPSKGEQHWCDDDKKKVSTGDFWKIFVR